MESITRNPVHMTIYDKVQRRTCSVQGNRKGLATERFGKKRLDSKLMKVLNDFMTFGIFQEILGEALWLILDMIYFITLYLFYNP